MLNPERGRTQVASGHISPAERERMIAEAAYFRAQKRDFIDGDPLADWLEAEREIDEMLPGPRQQEDALVYEKLRRMVRSALAELQQAVNEQTVRQAFDRATDELRKTGAHTSETVSRIAAALRKDIADAAAKMGPELETFSERSAHVFEVWRDRGTVFLAQAAQGVGQWLRQTGTRLGQQTYSSGETVYQGAFSCMSCDEVVVLNASGQLPHCPRCHSSSYKRI
jgi:hypothetical protein